LVALDKLGSAVGPMHAVPLSDPALVVPPGTCSPSFLGFSGLTPSWAEESRCCRETGWALNLMAPGDARLGSKLVRLWLSGTFPLRIQQQTSGVVLASVIEYTSAFPVFCLRR